MEPKLDKDVVAACDRSSGPTLRRALMTSVPAFVALVACSSARMDSAAGEVESLHGSSTGVAVQDTLFPGVGTVMGGCTATLVAPDVALTAAHCITNYADKCGTERGLMTSPQNGTMVLTLDGTTVSFTASADAAIAHPLSVVDLSVCNSSNPLNCNMPNQPNVQTQIRVGHDLALIHLSGAVNGLPDPSTYPRLPVVTDINANSGGTLYTLHRHLNQTTEFGPTQQVWACGFGSNDVSSSGIRFRGLLEFWQPSMVSPPSTYSWLWPGQSYYSCNGQFVTNADPTIYLNRTSTGGSTFNGAANDKGDSGSPLLIQGGLERIS